MTDTGQSTLEPQPCDLRALRVGDCIEAWDHDTLHHRGRVEETAPQLGVVWIREIGGGERKMVSTDEHSIRLC